MGKPAILIWAMALLAALFAGVPATATASVPLQVCVARSDAPQATPPDCSSPQVRHGPGDFKVDLRFAPVVAAEGDPLVLGLTSVWQDGARIGFRYADGSHAALAFTPADASRFLGIGALYEFPVPIREAALTGIRIETEGSANLRGIAIGPTLMARSESYAVKTRLIVLYAAFGGLATALIVYNFSLWAAMRNRFQLLYCAMVASIAAYTFTSSAAMTLLLSGLDNNDRLRINYVLLALAAVTALYFVRHFFEPKVFGPKLARAIPILSAATMLSAFAFALLAPWQIWVLDRAYFLAIAVLMTLIVPILISAWRNRSRYFWMFVLAWSAPVLTSVLRTLYGFNLIGYSFWLDNGNLIALSVEALLSSLMVTARLREIGRERDLAQAGEIVARRLANTDPLTGLLNRRAFLELAIGTGERTRLMLIDIDRFKAINDRCGHDMGDEVLRAVAETIQSCRPEGSLAVRLGGEEFALLIPKAAFLECPPERVLQAVRKRSMPGGLGVTVSLGYADGVLASEDDWKSLYRLADAGLYRAKADGRDRACRLTDFSMAA